MRNSNPSERQEPPGLSLTRGWLVGELIRRIDGRSVGQYFREEIAEPFGLDFKIGLEDADIERCGDILVDPQPTPWALTLRSRLTSSCLKLFDR